MNDDEIYWYAQGANIAAKGTTLLGMMYGIPTTSPFLHAYQLLFGNIPGLIASAIMGGAGVFYLKEKPLFVALFGLSFLVSAGINIFTLNGNISGILL